MLLCAETVSSMNLQAASRKSSLTGRLQHPNSTKRVSFLSMMMETPTHDVFQRVHRMICEHTHGLGQLSVFRPPCVQMWLACSQILWTHPGPIDQLAIAASFMKEAYIWDQVHRYIC